MSLLRDELRAKPVPDWLRSVDQELPSQLPLRELLVDSLYYPASEFDGWPVQHLGGFVHSFVYVDFGPARSDLDEAIRRGFAGYRLLGERNVVETELAPSGWQPEFFPELTDEEAAQMHVATRDARADPFCKWFVFEREQNKGADHGPERFSLLYLRADGAAAYEPLYIRLGVRPAAIALVRSDTGFSGNYTSFIDPQRHLHRIVMRNGKIAGPEFMLVGWPGYRDEHWPEFNNKVAELQERAFWSRHAV